MAGRDKLAIVLPLYPSCTLHCFITAFYRDIELLRCHCMILPIIAVSGFTYSFETCVRGHIFGGSNCSVAVDYLMSV